MVDNTYIHQGCLSAHDIGAPWGLTLCFCAVRIDNQLRFTAWNRNHYMVPCYNQFEIIGLLFPHEALSYTEVVA